MIQFVIYNYLPHNNYKLLCNTTQVYERDSIGDFLNKPLFSALDPVQTESLPIQLLLSCGLYGLFGFDTVLLCNPYLYIAIFKSLYFCDPYRISNHIQEYLSYGLFVNSLSQDDAIELVKLNQFFSILQKGNYYNLQDENNNAEANLPNLLNNFNTMKYSIDHYTQEFNNNNKFFTSAKSGKLQLATSEEKDKYYHLLFNDAANQQIINSHISILSLGMRQAIQSSYSKVQSQYTNYFSQLSLDAQNDEANQGVVLNMLSPSISPKTINKIKHLVLLFNKFNNEPYKKQGFHILVVEDIYLTTLLGQKLQDILQNSQLRYFISEQGKNRQTSDFLKRTYQDSTLSKISELQKKHEIPRCFLDLNTLFHRAFLSLSNNMSNAIISNTKWWNINIIDISYATRMDLTNYNNIVFTGNLLNIKYDKLNIYEEPILIAYTNSLLYLDSAVESRFKYKITKDTQYPYHKGKIHSIICFILQNSTFYNNVSITYSTNPKSNSKYLNLLDQLANILINRGYNLDKCYTIIEFLYQQSQQGKMISIEQLRKLL